ncbi:single-stranded-DNA-specific exonuclease [Anaerotaenia torta]|uniref:single-stranded-DNA-specific exonuclease RecJ n=1 Tax=Anaerotaenia torta TaxID=433293 RepID=UPI003D1B1140
MQRNGERVENWVIKNKKADFDRIVKECGVSEVLARCLVNKGLEEPAQIEAFLHPKLADLHNPFLMKEMEKACQILRQKIAQGKRVRIIGDYDVDGVIATYVLYRSLKQLGALVDYEIPDRIRDGYGMNNQMVDTAYNEGIDTLLTCDNGIVALEQVELAKSLGMTVIITDHHSLLEIAEQPDQEESVIEEAVVEQTDLEKAVSEAAAAEQTVSEREKSTSEDLSISEMEMPEGGEAARLLVPIKDGSKVHCMDKVRLPQADAVVNPHRPDCSYPYSGLCGAAIAYKLCCALFTYDNPENREELEQELLSYTAIATVCDVMELTGENRVIVKHGLELLKETKNKGLLALMEVSGIDRMQLSTFHLGFIIGPCLNASGRLDTAKKGLELLLAETEETALAMAEEVRGLNELRKEMTARNVEKAVKLIEETPLQEDKVLVVYLENCHESIAGIIAGRIRERYHRPTLVLTDAENGVKGSGRSIEQYNMIEELRKCQDLFLKVGGHPMAAGLSLVPENVDILRRELNRNTALTWEMLVPKVSIDIHLPLGYINESLIHELKQLEPFGKGNEKPLFAEKELRVKSAFIIGRNASGIRMQLINKYGREMEAIYFGDVDEFFSHIAAAYGEEEAQKLRTGRSLQAALAITYFPKINEYNGFRNVQLVIQNYR